MWILEFVLQDNIFLLFVHNSRNLFTLLLRSLRTYRASALNVWKKINKQLILLHLRIVTVPHQGHNTAIK